MPQEQSNYGYADEHTALSELNLLGLLAATGREWTSLIQQESQAFSHPSPEQKKSSSTRSWILLGILSAFLFMSAATLTQTRGHSPTHQNINTVSSKQ
ncbi:MAG TPA: hypothetical protein V6C85_14685 [Allocoleopsis sp.]